MDREQTQGIYINRGYDIIKDCFFAVKEAPVLDEEGIADFDHTGKEVHRKIIMTFQTFDEYFACIHGEIYTTACYYGWKPSPEIISKYHVLLFSQFAQLIVLYHGF